ncbi:MAG: DUF1826 domain-containing protein [Methylovulum miyakonense]|uniref:DUF1826 domain-containing protein n=1 Tax=Methylovulum miyakonense TaxID=645578 RepID=UPI003BB5F299
MAAVLQPQHLPCFTAKAVISDDLADLSRIYAHDIHLCVVQRTVSEQIGRFVRQLLHHPHDTSVLQTVAIGAFDFQQLLPQHAHLAGYREFCQDLESIAALFSDLFDLPQVGLRLNTLGKAMCPKFHVDRVPCRLSCTYGGPGTEWLRDGDIDRRKLGAGANGLADDVSGLLKAHAAIQTVPTDALALLKGSAWEGNEQHGLVHRSPQLSPEAPRRLLLTLDFA